MEGTAMYKLAKLLFPICRSITGNGVRQTLNIIKRYVPDMNIIEVPTGTKVFDWEVPDEWNINDAYILNPNGEKIVDFKKSNLHVVGYSIPVNDIISKDELDKHLYSLPNQPNAIPYLTSYYSKRWGFCISELERRKMIEGDYKVYIDSSLKKGHLTYGEIIIPGETNKEIFLSTYICHPSMGNNETSGPVVVTFLAKWIKEIINRKYTYRIVFIPETIGSITYIAHNIMEMKTNIIAGFNVTCVGDNRSYSYLPSRQENSLADKIALHVLHHTHPNFNKYSYLDRGSDERQYCSPGVDLPVASIMRTKYGEYDEYHTSLDDINLISPEGLQGSYEVYQKVIECIENNKRYISNMICEPQLGKRGLYPTLSSKNSVNKVRKLIDFLAYCDGDLDLLEISEIIGVPMWDLYEIKNLLEENQIISQV
ncbi:DUF4910 domain-containing protein [Sedimentibacter sp.]|uniref:DUF4910 domain-containing protein n=1 Tax=Sedimentibacter sp. TaxID=1960295 RepID=UPI0028981993|nr:DUF4910 domain-containing protein [Sedimentibacter sp.]